MKPSQVFPSSETKPKLNVNYTKETLHHAIPYEWAETIVKEALKQYAKSVATTVSKLENIPVIEFSPELGTLSLAFLEQDAISGIYAYSKNETENTLFENNMLHWGFEENYKLYIDLTPDTKFTSLLDKCIIVVNTKKSDSIINNTLPTLLFAWRNAPLIIIRAQPGESAPKVNFKTEVLESEYETVYFLKYKEASEQKWKKDLKVFIKSFLVNFIEEAGPGFMYDDYVSESAMKYWEIAFTHESFDPSRNYEQFELLGDRCIEFVFTRYLFRRYPNITEHVATNTKSKYVRTTYFGPVAYNAGFGNHIRTHSNLTINIYEDTFEAFVGALIEVSDSMLEGAGYLNVSRLVHYLYDGMELELSEGDPSMIVPQLFTQLRISKPVANQYQDPQSGVWTTQIELPQDTLNALKRYGVRNISSVIGVAQDYVKKESSAKAYEEASKLLTNLGITKQWTTEVKRKLDFEIPEIADYASAARKKMKAEGYIDIYFQDSRTVTSIRGTSTILIGITQDGQKVQLSFGEGKTIIEAKQEAIVNYINNKQ